jgi:hypothetical protein
MDEGGRQRHLRLVKTNCLVVAISRAFEGGEGVYPLMLMFVKKATLQKNYFPGNKISQNENYFTGNKISSPKKIISQRNHLRLRS